MKAAYYRFKNLGLRVFVDESYNDWFSLEDLCKILGYTSSRAVTDAYQLETRYFAINVSNFNTSMPHVVAILNTETTLRLLDSVNVGIARQLKRWLYNVVFPDLTQKTLNSHKADVGSHGLLHGADMVNNSQQSTLAIASHPQALVPVEEAEYLPAERPSAPYVGLSVIDIDGCHVRTTTGSDGKRWFVAKDIGDMLGLLHAKSFTQRLGDDEKSIKTVSTMGGLQKSIVVSDIGFYKIVTGCRKPKARGLVQWMIENLSLGNESAVPAIVEPQQSQAEDKTLPFVFHGKAVRVVPGQDGQAWFVARDVCEVLGISDYHQSVNSLDADERGRCTAHTPGGRQQVSAVSESGLYALIFASRKPEAKAFRKWITSEVIPSIRRHGAYMLPAVAEQASDDPDYVVALAKQIKAEREKHQALESRVERLEEGVTYLEQVAGIMEPKARAFDAFMEAKDAEPMDTVAKILADEFTIGEKRLFSFLRRKRILRQDNKPFQKYVEMGHFRMKEYTHPDGTGATRAKPQTLVTTQGMALIRSLLLSSKGVIKMRRVA